MRVREREREGTETGTETETKTKTKTKTRTAIGIGIVLLGCVGRVARERREIPVAPVVGERAEEPVDSDSDAGAERPPEIVDVEVEGDRIVRVVQGRAGDRRALVYLPGRCGDDVAVRFFPNAVREHGTFIAVRGDIACDAPGRYKWTVDLASIQKRIDGALAAVSATRDEPLHGPILLMGYSEGATRVEALARRHPDRYPRVLLAGAPRAPKIPLPVRTAIVAGALDRRSYLEEATKSLSRQGADISIFILPDAHHGEYGPQAERTMSEALTWLTN